MRRGPISVIVPNLNGGQFLTSALESILGQSSSDCELVVVDGSSVDCSGEILERYKARIDILIVEPDTGQADAIMKGVIAAHGEVFNWINSDDMLLPGALAEVSRGIKDVECFAGAVREIDPGGFEVGTVVQRRLTSAAILRHPWRGSSYHQPGVWLRRDRFLACGGLDRSLHYAFDRDMMVRYLDGGASVRISDRPLAGFRLHPGSKTVSRPLRFVEEQQSILERVAECGSPKLKRLASRHLERLEWWRELEALRGSGRHGRRLATASRIVRLVAARPSVRVGRASVRSVVRVLLGH